MVSDIAVRLMLVLLVAVLLTRWLRGSSRNGAISQGFSLLVFAVVVRSVIVDISVHTALTSVSGSVLLWLILVDLTYLMAVLALLWIAYGLWRSPSLSPVVGLCTTVLAGLFGLINWLLLREAASNCVASDAYVDIEVCSTSSTGAYLGVKIFLVLMLGALSMLVGAGFFRLSTSSMMARASFILLGLSGFFVGVWAVVHCAQLLGASGVHWISVLRSVLSFSAVVCLSLSLVVPAVWMTTVTAWLLLVTRKLRSALRMRSWEVLRVAQGMRPVEVLIDRLVPVPENVYWHSDPHWSAERVAAFVVAGLSGNLSPVDLRRIRESPYSCLAQVDKELRKMTIT